MKVDVEKLEDVLTQLESKIFDWGGMRCPEASTFIGEFKGKPIRITIMTKEEAKEEHEYDGRKNKRIIEL